MLLAAFVLVMQQVPADCVPPRTYPPHPFSCSALRPIGRSPGPVHGPARLCSRHFVVALRDGDRLVSNGSAFDQQHVITDRVGRTLRFSDEAFADDTTRMSSAVRRTVRWRHHLLAFDHAGSSGVPYGLLHTSRRYVLASIDGTLLDGTPRDAVPLARLSVRTPDSRCERMIDLGTIGYSDEPDLSTMATR